MSSLSSNQWRRRQEKDPYVKLRVAKGYRSRAAFKLVQLHEKYHLFKPNHSVLDLGAAPGGWSQMLTKYVGEQGRVIAVDILPMDSLAGVEFIQGDFTSDDCYDQINKTLNHDKIDWIVSDMAPNMSGIQVTDQARMMHLAELCLEMAQRRLKQEGGLLVKLFQGDGFDAFALAAKKQFTKVRFIKPDASRNASREMYMLATGYNI